MRERQIVFLMNTGLFTLERVGKLYGISRERIRQIYKKKIGTSHIEKRDRLFQPQIQKEIKKLLKSVKFHCVACKKPVTYEKARNSYSLCKNCRKIQVIEQRNPYITLICTKCGKSYHPLRNYLYFPLNKIKHEKWGNFHSTRCYLKFKKGRKAVK